MTLGSPVSYLTSAEPLPPVAPGRLFEYVLAGDGVYLRAKRPGLEVCLPLAGCEVRGLPPLETVFEMGADRVPENVLAWMFDKSRTVHEAKGTEALFHLSWQPGAAALPGGWRVEFPEQAATAVSVRPAQTGAGTSTERALVELHSHHTMKAFFSAQDDRDESQGFRVYAVIGEIFERPSVRVRVGCYGHFFDVPAEWVFELPEWVRDCGDEEGEEE